MFCSRCGAEVVSSGAFCVSCGAPTGVGVERTPTLTRPGIITLLAVLQFIGAGIWLLVGVVGFGTAMSSDDTDRNLPLLVAIFFGAGGVLQLTCGIGLWKLKRYGRTLQLVFASIGLLGIPLGTIISICILIYLLKPGIRALFSGKTITEFSPAELTEIAAVTRGSQATTVLVVVLVGLGSIAVVGIIAAIAVPALLRARMTGNEASAIGSLRSINSAEASYAASAGKGGYAITLKTLSAACPGSSQGFISPELSQDPSIMGGFTISLGSANAGPGPNDCHAVPTEVDYYATGVPTTAGATGNKGFATSAAGAIFFDPSGDAPTLSVTLAGTAPKVE
jgi:type IV pilus assembly protein PilA